jgi:predicted acyl esterase
MEAAHREPRNNLHAVSIFTSLAPYAEVQSYSPLGSAVRLTPDGPMVVREQTRRTMRVRGRTLIMSALALIATVGLLPLTGPATAGAAVTVSVTTLHYRVVIGPNHDQVCDVLGDLYVPSTATAATPAPAILTTNGFGGSKDDQAAIGRIGAEQGYVVLSYSGLGFGGSGCPITLDDPTYDGEAASQLISFLGGAPGIAFTDAAHTQPLAPLDMVVHDAVAHDGHAYRYDPRVGMVGGSYGGEIQFAAADIDPRLDTIVPIITWNDLSYSLSPNNTDITSGVTSSTPGVVKIDWPTLFFADGVANGLSGYQADPSRNNSGCPDFPLQVCQSLAETALLGYPTPDTLAFLHHASVESYMSNIRIPTLLMQGQNDTLFLLNEAVATYQALRAQGTPVSMVWQSWGHSGSSPAPGEFTQNASVLATYEGQRVFSWFEHYLKGVDAAPTGPDFSFYRDWVPFSGGGPDSVQYGVAQGYPAGWSVPVYLSGADQLVSCRCDVAAGQALYTNAGVIPTSFSETSGIGSPVPVGKPPVFDAAPTAAAYTTPPLPVDVNVVGIPSVTLNLFAPSAAVTQGLGPSGMVELFAKLYDVAPNGTETLIHGLVSAARVADASQPVTVQLPGIVHRFARGHQIKLVIAASDTAFHGLYLPTPVAIVTGPSNPSVLELPIVP